MNSAFVLSWSLHWHFSFNMEPKLCLKFGLAWDLCSTFPLHHCILREYDVCYDKQDSVFSAVYDFVVFFVCHSNISGTAEQICAKFTGKTCLIPSSDDFECQGQRSRSLWTKTCCPLPSPRQRQNGTRSLQMTSLSGRRCHPVVAGGYFGGLALIFNFFYVIHSWISGPHSPLYFLPTL